MEGKFSTAQFRTIRTLLSHSDGLVHLLFLHKIPRESENVVRAVRNHLPTGMVPIEVRRFSMTPEPQLEFPIVDPPKKRRGPPVAKGYLVNPVKVRQYALDIAKRERFHEFTAVSVEFIQRIDAHLRNLIYDEIRRHPSRGKRLA